MMNLPEFSCCIGVLKEAARLLKHKGRLYLQIPWEVALATEDEHAQTPAAAAPCPSVCFVGPRVVVC